MKLDEKDIQILQLLKQNAELTSKQISKKTRIPITTIHNRIKKLKHQRVIKNYTLNLDYEKIGKPLTAYVLLTVNQNLITGRKTTQQEIGKRIKSHINPESVDIVTGSTDMIIKVRVENMHRLNSIITKDLRKIDGVDKTESMMVLEEL